MRWYRAIPGLVLVVALLIWILIAKDGAQLQSTRAEIQRRLNAIRANGQPLTAQDLAKLYPDPPPEQDANVLLKPALALLSIPDDSTHLPYFGLYLTRSTPLDPSAMAEGQQWLERNQAAFALIPWNKLDRAWIGSGLTNGLTNLTQAPLSKMNRLVRLLCLSAVLDAERQHSHEAVASLQRAALISNTLKNDLPIHFLSKATAQSQISAALERIINRGNAADADLASIPNLPRQQNLWENSLGSGSFPKL